MSATGAADPPHPDESPSFVLTGVVQRCKYRSFVLDSGQGLKCLEVLKGHSLPKPGDRVIASGTFHSPPEALDKLDATTVTKIGTGPVAPPRKRRLSELDPFADHLYAIDAEALVIDVLPDELDSRYDILLLKDGANQIPLFVPAASTNEAWLGARIRVAAEYRGRNFTRRFSGPYLSCKSQDIRTVAPPCAFEAAPPIDPKAFMTPAEVLATGRRSLTGVVLATWGGNNVMLKANAVVNAKLAAGTPLPPVNGLIKLAGYPHADLYKLNLFKADWRLVSMTEPDAGEEILTSVDAVIQRTNGKLTFKYINHGNLFRVSGAVKVLPAKGSVDQRLYIDVGEHRIPVDVSSCPDALRDVAPDCVVEVTGRCLMEVDAGRPHDVFQHISGFALVLRTAEDLRIVRKAPWWTPGRLLGLVISLAALLVGAIAWNLFLKRLVERRGRELFRAEIDRASETLRVRERTRLSVELHDSLSQNLTGVALQLKAGRQDLAARALKSCREELRNCLWDLRNNAIDCDSMDDAIRQTLAPHVEDITLAVRFNVPRKALSDNTAYAILRIIRELVTNAIRHGGAKVLRIAGSLEPDRLLFSVRDDGCGFDPGSRPGIAEGHFGLLGVQERVNSLGGEVTIDSMIGKGTKVTVIIPVNHEQNPHLDR